MIGKNINKLDSVNIYKGRGIYADDIAFPNSYLVVKILRSKYANAKIVDIDVSSAEKVPGVVKVFTYKDVPQIRYTASGKSMPEASPYDRLILEDRVRYIGDEVALIAAEDEISANKALKLIKVKYERYPELVDYANSEFNEIVVHEEKLYMPKQHLRFEPENNLIAQFELTKNDFDFEYERSNVKIDEKYYTQAQAHCSMETFRAMSYIDEDGRLVIIASTQCPYHVRRQVARALDLPVSRIRVIKPRIGGGFGAKTTVCVEPLVAFVTMKTGRAAKLIYSRTENFIGTSSRHEMAFRVRLGADDDGKIYAMRVDALTNAGAYGEDSAVVTMVAANNILPSYNKIDAIKFVGKTVYTNILPGSACRGYGAPQSAFAIESAMNELANKLNISPILLREKNMASVGDKGGVLHSEIKSCGLDKCIKRGKELINWGNLYPYKKVSEHKVRSVGMAIATHRSSIPDTDKAGVTLRLEDDGNFILYTGSADIGTGSDTILVQIAAHELGIPIDNIHIKSGDTDSCPYDSGAYASATTYVTGNAVIRACKEIKEEILNASCELLEEKKDNLEFCGLYVKSKNDECKNISLKELAIQAELANTDLIISSTSYGSRLAPLPFAAGFAEIEIDLTTGCYEIKNFAMVLDIGTIVNPKLARVQAEGGALMGIGMATCEEAIYTDKGKLLNNNFMQYKIPCRGDIREAIKIDFVKTYEPSGPFGAKSIGEVVVHTSAPAIANAVFNATGVQIRDLPITGEKIWKAMQEK